MPMWVYCADDLIIRECNNASLSFYGYSREEMIGRSLTDMRPDEDKEIFKKHMENIDKSSSYITRRWRHIKKDGQIIFVNIHSQPLKKTDLCNLRLAAISDITPQIEEEGKIKDAEALLRIIMESDNVAIFIYREKILYANYAAEKLSGYTSNELTRMPVWDLAPVSLQTEVVRRVRSRLSGGNEPKRMEVELIRKDGKILTLDFTAQNLTWHGERATIATVLDITDRKLAESKIFESERRLRYLFNSANEGIVILDENHTIRELNHKMAEMLGYIQGEMLGRPLHQFIAKEQMSLFFHAAEERKVGKPDIFERKFIRKDGTPLWGIASVAPILNAKGEFNGAIGMVTDITERKRVEEYILEAKQKAEESDRMKDSFLANMSHELRTPLTGIIGYSEIIGETSRDEIICKMAASVRELGERLKRTVSQILEFTSLKANKVEPNFETIVLNSECAAAASLYQAAALGKNLNYSIRIPNKSIELATDRILLFQIIGNLLDNAIKYTQQGGIAFTVAEQNEATGRYVYLTVSDTGIGMTHYEKLSVFQDFIQASGGFSRSFEGSGLGLSITKRYIELLGGTIIVESAPGKGSTFTVRFPADAH